MKTKILALFIVGMFILTCISTFTVLGKDASKPQKMVLEKTMTIEIVEKNSAENSLSNLAKKEVVVGSVYITGTNDISTSVVNVKPVVYQKIEVDGPTMIDFVVSGWMDCENNFAWADVEWSLTLHDRSWSIKNRMLPVTPKVRQDYKSTMNKLAIPGYTFTFTIVAVYYLFPNTFVSDIGIGGGKIVDKDDDSTPIENPVLSLKEKVISWITNLIEFWKERFPIFERASLKYFS